MIKYLFCLLFLLALPACQKKAVSEAEQIGQEIMDEIAGERLAQENLPQSDDPIWQILAASQVDMDSDSGFYEIKPAQSALELVGQSIEISGFILPLDGSDMTRHFLIGVNTPVCFYHPPGEPNQVIEVYSKTAVKWTTEKEIKVKGKFELANDPEMGVFFKLTDATSIK